MESLFFFCAKLILCAPGGGWPGTNEDIMAALQRIVQLKAAEETGDYGDLAASQRGTMGIYGPKAEKGDYRTANLAI